MHTKLAGRLPLQEMISQHIEAARTKLAAAEDKEKVKKLVAYEKKEHGHVPSEKEEQEEHEKKSSAFDPFDPEQVEKLASALDSVGEKLAADGTFIGGESRQGGELMATMGPVGGKQQWAKAHAKHQVPNHTGMISAVDNPGAATAVPTDDKRAPGGTGAKYPAKGVLKTASESVLERIAAKKAEMSGEEPEPQDDEAAGEDEEGEEKTAAPGNIATRAAGRVGRHLQNIGEHVGSKIARMPVEEFRSMRPNPAHAKATGAAVYGGGAATAAGAVAGGKKLFGKKKKDKGKTKRSSAVDFILDKIEAVKTAEFMGGGEVTPTDEHKAPGYGSAKIPAEGAKLQNKDQIKNVTKREAKAPRKKELAQVLTEPALTSSTDNVVQTNLRNASKGGVKIAAAKAYLKKIASEGCSCDGGGTCRHCKLAAAIEARKAS